LFEFGEEFVLKISVEIGEKNIDTGKDNEEQEESLYKFEITILCIFDDIGGNIGYTIGLKQIDKKTCAYHGNHIERLFLVEFFQ
jgi:hypothetical protein